MMTTKKPNSFILIYLLITRIVCLATLAFPIQAFATESRSGFLDFNIYPYLSDVSGDSVITINALAKLENRFTYFSLTNFGSQSNRSELADTTTFYTEQNIRWQITDVSPFDLTLQLNFRTGDDNDRHRLGFRWRLNDTGFLKDTFGALNLNYAINVHALQLDHEPGSVWQMEHTFRMTFPWLTNRLYLAGFIDHTFGQELAGNLPKNPAVGEAQFGFKLIDELYFVAEYRLNQYRRADVNNLAVGIEYKITW